MNVSLPYIYLKLLNIRTDLMISHAAWMTMQTSDDKSMYIVNSEYRGNNQQNTLNHLFYYVAGTRSQLALDFVK